MNLKNMLNERIQAQKNTHCPIPFMGNVQKRQIYIYRKLISNCLRLKGGENGIGEGTE